MFLDYVEINEKRFFVLFLEPLLVETSIKTGKVINYKKIIGEKGKAILYKNIFYYNNKILLVPWHSKVFSVYDLNRDVVRGISIPFINISKYAYGYFGNAIQLGKKIYTFGVSYPGIVKIDFEDERAELLIDLRSEINTTQGFGREMVCDGDNIILSVEESSKICVFNIKTEKTSFISSKIFENNEIIKTICCDGKNIWIFSSSGKTYIYDMKSKRLCRNQKIDKKINNWGPISHSAYQEGQLFLFPQKGNKILKYSIDDDELSLLSVPINSADECFYYVKVKDNKLFFFSEITNLLYCYDDEIGEFKISDKQLNEDEYMKLLLNCGEVSVIEENEKLLLKRFINSIY